MTGIVFLTPDGKRIHADAQPGVTLLAVAQAAGMPLEGTCEGQMACSTCHVIVAEDWFAQLPEPSPEEEDMLDLAVGVQRTSRLSCQIEIREHHEGMVVRIPNLFHDMQIG
ncbi:MAG TPA: 2Fe-2S iron-sulfur cluster-binding protein [Novosphingobium sp.]|nr:2Fe-2S iron-sulfur cluster-binding protein [Novosphingobium sp.]